MLLGFQAAEVLQRLISAKLFFSPYYGKTEILNVALPFMADACGGVSSGEQSWPNIKKSWGQFILLANFFKRVCGFIDVSELCDNSKSTKLHSRTASPKISLGSKC